MPELGEWLEKADSLIQQSEEEESKGNHDTAFNRCRDALEWYTSLLKWEPDPNTAESVRQKCSIQLDRADRLKRLIPTRKPLPPDPICVSNPTVKLSEVIGSRAAKEKLQQEIIFPLKFPHLFTSTRVPNRTFLVYGLPGAGKKELVEAIATETKSTLYTLYLKNLIRLSVEGSRRKVEEFFAHAVYNKPVVVLLNELEAFWSLERNQADHANQVLDGLAVQLDRCTDSRVLIFGICNRPWEIHDQLFKRLTTRIELTLPGLEDRISLLRDRVARNLGQASELTDEDYQILAKRTERYSIPNINTLCREAVRLFKRRMLGATAWKSVEVDGKVIWRPCSPEEEDAIEQSPPEDQETMTPGVTLTDFDAAIRIERSTVSPGDIRRYEQWAASEDCQWIKSKGN